MLKLMIVLCSTRPGRVGLPVARWFCDQALQHAGFEVDFVDLAELDLPFVDEPNHPRLRNYTQQHTRDWSARVDVADAFVFVSPEYNHGMTAPLKNAIDFLHHEWGYKPVGLVSYGGVSAGTRAVEHIKTVVSTLKMMPMFETVAIPFVGQFMKEGRFEGNEVSVAAAKTMLDEMERWGVAMKTIREKVT